MKKDFSIDQNLSQIEGLKWLPWIGNQFLELYETNRLLIVGESHYHDATEQSIEKHDSPKFTRIVIDEMAICRQYYKTKIFSNLHRALFRNDCFDAKVFWNNVSFLNFIQKPMNTNKDRPEYDDFYNGWKTFFVVVKVLKPTTCIFIGTTAANSFTNAIQNTGFSTDGLKREDHIGRTYAKTAVIKDQEDNEIKIIFIRHTSQMFSWSKWNDYIKKVIPAELTWLENEIKLNHRLK
jgi:hypothetical protein